MRVLLIALLAAISYAQTDSEVKQPLALGSPCDTQSEENPTNCEWIFFNWSVWRKLMYKCNGRPTYVDREGRFAYVSPDKHGHWWGITSRTQETILMQDRFKTCSWEFRFAHPAPATSSSLTDITENWWDRYSYETKQYQKIELMPAYCIQNDLNGCIDADCDQKGSRCGFGDCSFLKDLGECRDMSGYMTECCKKECEADETDAVCQNFKDDCAYHANMGACEKNEVFMRSMCPMACNFCDPCAKVRCWDPPNECHQNIGLCKNGQCSYVPIPRGMPCNNGLSLCNGQGSCEDTWTTGALASVYAATNIALQSMKWGFVIVAGLMAVGIWKYGFQKVKKATYLILQSFVGLYKACKSTLCDISMILVGKITKLRTANEVPRYVDYGKCRCNKIQIMKKEDAKPWAVYRCHCSICREHGSEDGGIKWIGFNTSDIKFPNAQPEYFQQQGKRFFCPECSVGLLMGYHDGFIYIDSKRTVDAKEYTNKKLLQMARTYHKEGVGTPFAHIHCVSDDLPQEYRFEPKADFIFEYDGDAQWGHIAPATPKNKNFRKPA